MKKTEWLSSAKNSALFFWLSRIPDFPFSPSLSSDIPFKCATHLTKLSDWCVFKLSAMNRHLSTSGWDSTVCFVWSQKSFSVRVSVMLGLIICPLTTSKFAIKHCVPCRSYSYSRFRGWPTLIGKSAAVRSKA